MRVLSRLLGHLLAVIRPRMAVTRACYVLLGIVLLLGALCSEDHATALAVVGVILLFLRRAPGTRRARIKNVAKQPSATRTRTRVRVSYVLLGIILLLGALGAEQDGQRGYAIALSMAGATLLLLRRRSVQDDIAARNCACGTVPSGIPVAEPAVPFGIPATAPATDKKLSQSSGKAQMPSDLLKSGWTRKGVAVNKQGEPVLSDDPTAAAWSLCGAVNTVFEPDSAEWKSYMRALKALVGHNIVRWNGDSNRTHEEVVAVALEAEGTTKG